MSGGFLKEEGLDGVHSVSAPNSSAIQALLAGEVDVGQSAVSHVFGPLQRGEDPVVRHFAQINATDGFFLVGRKPEPDFSWARLAGRTVIVDHGVQPMAMFKYGCHRMGLDYAAIDAIDAGTGEEMERSFRDGQGDYLHLQGPAPQQIEHDGAGHVVAELGAAVGPCAFSSIAAMPDWLETDMARAFMRAFRKARQYIIETDPAEVARAEGSFFPGIDSEVLAATIAAYQKVGCWLPQVEITREGFEASVDVFAHAGLITKRPDYDLGIAPPPEG